MNEKLKNKIRQVQEMAKKSGKAGAAPERSLSKSNDSLSQVIRNKREAEVFMAELNAVIAIARSK